MSHPAYPAARSAAARVHPHFARHHATGTDPGLLPDLETIEAMIDVAFWASLRREEIYTPRISLAFAAPGDALEPLILDTPVPLAPQPLTRLGPAVERPGIHLCVTRREGELVVWGATRMLPGYCFVLEVLAPGLLAIKHSGSDAEGGLGKFVNVAVLQGEEIKVVDRRAALAPDCPAIITSLLGLESQFTAREPTSVLIQLAVSMRAHGRGGTLLVVPAGAGLGYGGVGWRDSILQPMMYGVAPAFAGLAELMEGDPGERPRRRWQQALQRMVEGVAGLTAVDGATVITDRYEVLAFGAKIIRRPGCGQVNQVVMTEPIEGSVSLSGEPGMLGGTRHLSAAQFASDQQDTIALVASQDGRFTVFAWSKCQEMVHAHRVESLLL